MNKYAFVRHYDSTGRHVYWDGYILRDGESINMAMYHGRPRYTFTHMLAGYDMLIEDGYISEEVEYEVQMCDPLGNTLTTVTNEGDWALAFLTFGA